MTSPDDASPRGAPLSPERWARLRALVDEAITLTPDQRPAYIAAACGTDAALAAQVVRLADACDRADEGWGFLAQSAGDLSAPLVVLATGPPSDGFAVGAEVPLRRARTRMADVLARLRLTLGDRYDVERELASGGMATVYLARDLRHERRVAIKVLHPELSAMLGAERFLSEIKTTASLHHPHILPLFDSGSADDLLYYVMPLVEGESLRARIAREKQLPVADAVAIVSEVADALEYAHRRGVVHRDIKPENILLHEGRPLVADFGIALAMQSAGAERMTRTGLSLGTPPYMSPEQASGGGTIDGRSDVYSLACVLYEMLVGDPPFTGSTPQIVIARVLGDPPSPVRTVRPNVPVHIEAAIARALSKLPADRPESARAFAESLVSTNGIAFAEPPRAGVDGPPVMLRAGTSRSSTPMRLALGAMATIALATAGWIAARQSAAPADTTPIRFPNLIEQAVFSFVAITPNGRDLVYTGSAEAGRPLMVQSLDGSAPRTLRGTEGAMWPAVAPDGQRVAYFNGDYVIAALSVPAVAGNGTTRAWLTHWSRWVASRMTGTGWRYGNGTWDGNDVLVWPVTARGLVKVPSGAATPILLTRPNVARGESRHDAPLVLSDARAVVFTVSMYGGRGIVAGPLAIASLDPGATIEPHVWLGIEGRHAIAFVDGWLLYTSVDGLAIMAVRLDVARRKIIGAPLAVFEEPAGSLEMGALANNGSLQYLRRPQTNYPVLVDTAGAVRPLLAGSQGPFMYPRLSPDGKRFAMQASTPQGGNDIWVYDIATRTPGRLTTTGHALHPTWTPDGLSIVYMVPRGGLVSQPVRGNSAAVRIPGSDNAMGPTVAPDGGSVLYQRPGIKAWDVWSASTKGDSAAHRVIDGPGSHSMPALSPDGHWLAYVSTMNGQSEVFVRPFPGPGAPLQVSDGGGVEPAWSPDGERVYYRNRGAFMAVGLRRPALAITSRRQLFKDSFDGAMPHRNYDVAPDGSGFLMIAGGSSEVVVVLNWLTDLRARLARAP